MIRGSRKKKSANLEKIRLKSHVISGSSSKSSNPQHHQQQQQLQPQPNTSNDRLSLSAHSIESGQNDTLLLVTNEKKRQVVSVVEVIKFVANYFPFVSFIF